MLLIPANADWLAGLQGYTAGTITIEAPEVLAQALIATLPDSASGAAADPSGKTWRLPFGSLSFAGSTNQPLSPGKARMGAGYFSRCAGRSLA